MLFLDTSALVASLSGERTRWQMLRLLLERREQLRISAPVLYEWRRGDRSAEELRAQHDLFPDASAVPFTHREAFLSAELYSSLPRARARAMDFAIAACAISHEARLWTLNRDDFADIPGLDLLDLV
ncbi:MAG: type II toxin-antitoxin system VapC family toxin [Terriglobales bacterium]